MKPSDVAIDIDGTYSLKNALFPEVYKKSMTLTTLAFLKLRLREDQM